MYRFGEQIEYRIDRRQMIWLFLGGLCWTILAFLLGMMAAERGSVRKNLMALGWWETPEQNILTAPNKVRQGTNGGVGFTFAPSVPGKPTKKIRGESEPKTDLREDVPERTVPVPRVGSSPGEGAGTTQNQGVANKQTRVDAARKTPSEARHTEATQDQHKASKVDQQVQSPVKSRGILAKDSTESSILAEAKAFRMQVQRTPTAVAQTHRDCEDGASSATATSYYGVVVKTPIDIVSMRRWRKLLKQAGYGVKIKKLRVKNREDLFVVVGRFATRNQGQQCLQHLTRTRNLSGKVVQVHP